MSKETTNKQGGGATIIQLRPKKTASQTNKGMAILKSIFTPNYFTIA